MPGMQVKAHLLRDRHISAEQRRQLFALTFDEQQRSFKGVAERFDVKVHRSLAVDVDGTVYGRAR